MKIYQEPFYQISDDNVTTCTIKAVVKLFDDDLIGVTFEAKGIAKCHPDDQFNVVTGKRIAESRAAIELYSAIRSTIDRLIGIFDNKITHLALDIPKVEKCLNRELKHLTTLKN